ncbi:MAG: hypothetical protein PVSMB4_03740 [Ktedonobacterales bacterium]
MKSTDANGVNGLDGSLLDPQTVQAIQRADGITPPGVSPELELIPPTHEAATPRSDDTAKAGNLPIDPDTGQPLPPRAQPGYYPGFNTLSQQAFWDEATRTVVLQRVNDVPPIRFFRQPDELRFAEALFARVLPQDDRDDAHKIPIVPYVDRVLHDKVIPGYRFEGMPNEQDVYRLGFRGIEEIAQFLYDRSFVDLGPREQDVLLQTLHEGNPPAGHEIWKQVSVRHFWLLVLNHAVEAYYAHPYAWDEIGFGGPAYPRGYMRLERGEPEPWEVREERYEWEPPPASHSSDYAPIGGKSPLDEQIHGNVPIPGQQGTH